MITVNYTVHRDTMDAHSVLWRAAGPTCPFSNIEDAYAAIKDTASHLAFDTLPANRFVITKTTEIIEQAVLLAQYIEQVEVVLGKEMSVFLLKNS